MTTTVKYFNYAQQGAPSVTNNWGDLITLLDACLVTGFYSTTISSLTSSGGVASATITGHAYVLDQVVLIAGADQAEYNGEHRITAVSTNLIQFAVTGSPATPATTSSAISCKVAPLGFEKIYSSGLYKAVYRSQNNLSNRPYLRVDNGFYSPWTTTYFKFAKVTMAEGMADVDTFLPGGRAPFDWTNTTKNEGAGTFSGVAALCGWFKWYSSATTNTQTTDGGVGAKFWAIVGDDRGFYLHIATAAGNNLSCCYAFNDFKSYKNGDAYNTLLSASDYYIPPNGQNWQNEFGNYFGNSADTTGKVLMKDNSHIGDYTTASFVSVNPTNAQIISGYTAALPYPNGADFSLVLFPTYIRESSTVSIRGQMPGLFYIPQAVYNIIPPYTVLSNVAGYPDRKFVILQTSNAVGGRVAYDITGPWDR